MDGGLADGVRMAVQWLFGPLLALVALAWLCLRLEAAGTFDAIRDSVRKMSVFQRFAATAFLAVFIVFASEKTNAPNVELGMENVELSQLPSPGATSILHSPFSILNSFSGLPAPLPAEPFAAPSGGATTNTRWRVRGAFEDAVRIPFPGEDGFPWRGGVATALTAFACGEFRPDASAEYFPAPFGDTLSLPPLWRQDTNAPSVFWHFPTASNSLVVTWENALHGRDAACPTNFQAEFFADGSFIYRYPDHATAYPPVLPFDYDGDGLENSVDPEPEVPGPDAHGTNAQWYNTVCSNILAAAEATNCVPPVSLAWLDGVNSNAYYFVDVVAERGPAPVCFFDASGRMPDDPVVVAGAGAVCRVPLVIGVEYAVTSSVPFTISPAYGCEIGRPTDYTLIIEPREGGGTTVHWPIRFSYRETTDDTHFALDAYPGDLGLEYSWHVLNGELRMENVELSQPSPLYANSILHSPFYILHSTFPSCFQTDGSNVTMVCAGNCGCDGCTLGGNAYLMGHSFPLPTFQCGCEPPHEPDPEEQGEPPDPSQASISVSYSTSVVIYEATYVDSPGHVVPGRSTPVSFTISASGGPHGGHYSISMPGFGRLVPTEPVDFSTSGDLGPYETVCFSASCEGCAPSSSKEDVGISGVFVENETGCRFTSKGTKLTVFRVELQPKNLAPENSSVTRHTYGIGEAVQFLHAPSNLGLTIVANGWSETSDNPRTLTCPLNTQNNQIRFEYADVSYAPYVHVVAPTDIVCTAVGFLPAIPVAGIGMALRLQVLPLTVSFEGLEMQEVPADENNPSNWGTHLGYFSNTNFMQRWAHYRCWGAGTWRAVIQENCYGTYDSSRLFEWPQPWDEGSMTWRIPIGWNRRGYSGASMSGQFPSDFNSVWNMTDAAVEKIKHGQNLTLTSSGAVFINSERVSNE